MKKYSFLFKPLFYILSLAFATWLVIKIEEVRPSDFGQTETKTPNSRITKEELLNRKKNLRTLFREFKEGKIDSTQFDNKLTFLLEAPAN